MSDTSQGEGWWQASDGKWYAPQSANSAPASPPPPAPMGSQPQGEGVQRRETATAALVCGIVGLCLSWIPFVGFVGLVLGLIAVAGLMVAAFCGIRWSLIPNLNTTDQHVADLRADYATRPSAELIREYEQMVGDGIELGKPFTYKRIADEKQRWGRIAAISAGVGLLAALMAFGFAALGRRPATS